MKRLSPLYIIAIYLLVSFFWLVTSDYITFQNAPEWAFLLEPLSDTLYIIFSSALLFWLIHKANKQAKTSDANYQHLFENIPQPMWVYDPQTLLFLAVNRAAIAHYGYSQEEFLRMTKREICPAADLPLLLEDVEQMKKGGQEVIRLWRHQKKDDTLLYVETTSRSLTYQGRSAILELAQDVTERIHAGNRLRYHEELLQKIYERIPIGIGLINQESLFEEVNPAFCRIFGYSVEEIIGNASSRLLPAATELQKVEELNLPPANDLSHPSAEWAEWQVRQKSGEMRWVLAKGVLIRDVHNNPRMALFVNDISDWKKASQDREIVLHELQNYKQILDKSALVSVTDLKGNIIHANDLFCQIAQFSREELLGQNHRIINSGFHSRSFFRDMWRTISSGHMWRGEIRNRTKEGSYYWVDTIINPIFDERGNLIQYLSIRYDITDRKNNEERLKQSEAALREAQTLAKMGSWEYQIAGGIITWSDEAYPIHGSNKADGPLTLEHLENLYHPEDFPIFQRLLMEALTKGTPYHQDIRIVLPGGMIRYINITGKPEYDEQGKVVKLYGTVTDINERKLVEQHLQLQNEELKKINEELDRFVYSAGHDLRAPLMSVLGLINIAQMDEQPGKKNEYMELMRRSIHKLDEFIKDIIHFSRNARTVIAPQPIDFDALVSEAIANLHYMKGEHSIDTHLHVQQDGVFYSDPKRVAVVLNNLLSNAFRYSDPYKDPPFVHVQVHANAEEASISIQDNGIGIEGEHLDKIFRMFYRATESRSGSGLGLYIVKETITTLKGQIQVQSKPREGTSFYIKLPNLRTESLLDEQQPEQEFTS